MSLVAASSQCKEPNNDFCTLFLFLRRLWLMRMNQRWRRRGQRWNPEATVTLIDQKRLDQTLQQSIRPISIPACYRAHGAKAGWQPWTSRQFNWTGCFWYKQGIRIDVSVHNMLPFAHRQTLKKKKTLQPQQRKRARTMKSEQSWTWATCLI